jgi:hypothetical protein
MLGSHSLLLLKAESQEDLGLEFRLNWRGFFLFYLLCFVTLNFGHYFRPWLVQSKRVGDLFHLSLRKEALSRNSQKLCVVLGRKTPDLRCALWLHLLIAENPSYYLAPKKANWPTHMHFGPTNTCSIQLVERDLWKKCMFLMLFLYSKIHLVQPILISTKNCPGQRDMWEFVLKGNIGKEQIKDFPWKIMDQISTKKIQFARFLW